MSLILINIEMADVVLCEHQKKNLFGQDVTVREDLLCGRSTACHKSGSKDITSTFSYSHNRIV